MEKEISLREHLSHAGKARWKGKSAKERADHGKMMREARRQKEMFEKNI